MGKALEIGKNLGLLKKYSAELNAIMEDGSFYRLSFTERFKLVRRVKKLYNRLLGPISAFKLRHVLAAAGVLTLSTACFVPVGMAPDLRSGGTDDPGTISGGGGGFSLIPYFDWRGTNPYGIRPLGSVNVVEEPGTHNLTYRISRGTGFAFVDMDGDGDFDIVHSGAYMQVSINYYDETFTYVTGAELTWQENIGTQTEPQFSDHMPLPVAAINHAGSPAFADMDDDGDQDLWLATQEVSLYRGPYGDIDAEGVVFFENTGAAGSPYFEFRGAYFDQFGYVEGSNQPDVAAGDIDSDGDFDLLVTGPYTEGLVLFENFGTPEEADFSFQSPSYGGLGYMAYYVEDTFVLVDVDSDGDLDIVATDVYGYDEGVIVLNEGDGLNPSFSDYFYDYNLDFRVGDYYGGYYDLNFPRVVDLDGDGDIDVFAFNGYYNTGEYTEGAYGWSYNEGGIFFFENIIGEDIPH